MMLTKTIRFAMLLLVLPCAQGHAGEILASGKVVRVVPINARSHVTAQTGECEPARPAASAGLAALLAWDLRARCHSTRRKVDVVQGYRVYYEWDDRVYDTVMAEPPAATIPLRISVQ